MFKILFHCLTLTGQLISTPIHIIYDVINVDPQCCREISSYPLSAQVHYLQINDAAFSNLDYQSIGYRQYDASCMYNLHLTSHTGLLFSSGYSLTHIDWKTSQPLTPDTPASLGYDTFQKHPELHYCSLSLGAYTHALKKWEWSVMVSSLLDPHHPSIDYGLYRGIVVSRYQTSPNLSVALGVMQEIGLNQKKTKPVLGLVYKPMDKLVIDCIYPLNFSMHYQCTDVCDLGIAYKITKYLKKLPVNDLASSQGILEYQGRAIEGNIKLIPWPGSFVKAFGGMSLGRTISLTDAQNQEKQTYHFQWSNFFGGSVSISF